MIRLRWLEPDRGSLIFVALALVISLGIPHLSYGSTQPRLSKSSLSNLLQQPTVTAIHRDKSGLFWIGTQQGLHQFDGAKVTIFNSAGVDKTWIPNSEIKDIAEDANGNLLVATSGGALLTWDRQLQKFDVITQFGAINKPKLIRLLILKNGSIWLLTQDGLILYDPKFNDTADWMMGFNLSGELNKSHVIVEGSSNEFWVGGKFGLTKVTPKDQSLISYSLKQLGLPTNTEITALEFIGDDIIIGTNSGHVIAWDIDKNQARTKRTIGSGRSNYISQILRFEDNLIIATDGGLFNSDINLSHIEEVGKRNNRPSELDVFSLYRDGKYIWVGTIDGLNTLTFGPFTLYNSNNSNVSSHVLAFGEDPKGRIWIGTYSGLYYYDEFTKEHIRIPPNSDSKNPVDERITSIATRENRLWLGYFQSGLEIVNLDVDNPKIHNFLRFNGMPITKILTRKNENTTWISTYDHGLFRIKKTNTHSYLKTNSLPEKSITALFQSNNEILFAVSESKIYIHDPATDQFSQQPFNFGLNGKKPIVYSFGEARDGDIWIGTKDHGLFVWARSDQEGNRFNLIPAKGGVGLATSTIYGIEIDSVGNLWCSTQNGIIKLDPEGRLIKRFTATDGLQGNDFSFGASFTSREGLIYFGGVNGYNRFDPDEVTIDNAVSEMRLTDVSLPKGKERNLGPISELKFLELTHEDHFVTFEFSVLDFIHPERNQYRYKLDEFDPDWISNGTRNTATYTNLPAGNFTLRIQGANSAGIWNRQGITLNIRVLPAPWLTWWAYCIYGFLLLLFIWGLSRIFQSYEAKRQSEQLEIQMFEAENRADDDMQEQLELQDELIHSAYQHNQAILSLMRDCINYQSNSLPQDIQQYLNESSSKKILALSSLESALYYQAGGPVANLKAYTDSIINILLKDAPVEPQTIVTINEVSPKLIPAELATPLSIVIYELLENSIQHAFELDSPANYIHIGMTHRCASYPSDYHVELSVRDSGNVDPDSIEELARANSGLSIVRLIIDKLGGTLEFSSDTGAKISVDHSDLEDTNLSDNHTLSS